MVLWDTLIHWWIALVKSFGALRTEAAAENIHSWFCCCWVKIKWKQNKDHLLSINPFCYEYTFCKYRTSRHISSFRAILNLKSEFIDLMIIYEHHEWESLTWYVNAYYAAIMLYSSISFMMHFVSYMVFQKCLKTTLSYNLGKLTLTQLIINQFFCL